MRCNNEAEATAQAKANATRSREPWGVFVDTNGRYNAEPWSSCSGVRGAVLVKVPEAHAVLLRTQVHSLVGQYSLAGVIGAVINSARAHRDAGTLTADQYALLASALDEAHSLACQFQDESAD